MVYQRPSLYRKQREAFFCDKRYGLIEASTKSGKTHGGIAWLFEQALFGTKWLNYWWIAPVYQQAEIAYRRLKIALPEGLRVLNDTSMKVTLTNGHSIWFKSGEKPDNLYGEDVGAAVIDEASRLREESWHAVRTTLTRTGGPIRMIGNVKGRKNWFYRMARQAEAGAADMRYSKITASDAVAVGVLKAEEVEDARRILPEAVFRELYLAEASDDGGNPFGISHIANSVGQLSCKQPLCFGVDLAKSTDYTVVVGIDDEGRVCAFDRFQLPWLETIKRVREVVQWNRALVDSTGVGDPVLEQLQRGGLGDQFASNFEGYKFTSESKQRLMEGLAVGIQQRRIGILEGVMQRELESYEYEYTRTGVRYTAPEGQHDDCVCALALAWNLFETRSVKPFSAMSAGNLLTQPGITPGWAGY